MRCLRLGFGIPLRLFPQPYLSLAGQLQRLFRPSFGFPLRRLSQRCLLLHRRMKRPLLRLNLLSRSLLQRRFSFGGLLKGLPPSGLRLRRRLEPRLFLQLRLERPPHHLHLSRGRDLQLCRLLLGLLPLPLHRLSQLRLPHARFLELLLDVQPLLLQLALLLHGGAQQQLAPLLHLTLLCLRACLQRAHLRLEGQQRVGRRLALAPQLGQLRLARGRLRHTLRLTLPRKLQLRLIRRQLRQRGFPLGAVRTLSARPHGGDARQRLVVLRAHLLQLPRLALGRAEQRDLALRRRAKLRLPRHRLLQLGLLLCGRRKQRRLPLRRRLLQRLLS